MKNLKILFCLTVALCLAGCSSFIEDLHSLVEPKGTAYKVIHNFEKKDLTADPVISNKDDWDQDIEILYGEPETETAAVAKTDAAFTAEAFTQETISADGSTAVNIFYKRNAVTITLSCGEGIWNYKSYKADPSTVAKDTDDKTVSGKAGNTIDYSAIDFTQAGKTSCILDKWSDGTKQTLPLEKLSPVENFPAQDTTYTAVWKDLDSVNYSVQHWFEKADSTDSSVADNFTLEEDKTQTLSGKPETMTQAEPLPVTGFKKKDFVQAEIKADGSTVVKIYYVRNVYDMTFYTDDGLWNYDNYKARTEPSADTEARTISGKFGSVIDYSDAAKLNSFSTLKKLGQDLAGWKKGEDTAVIRTENLPETFPAENTSYTAAWNTKALTRYTVIHMTENADSTDDTDLSNYSQHSTDTTKKGIPEYNTEALPKTITGFTVKEPVVQEEIKEDGSTEVKIYYKCNVVKVTFDLDGGYWNYTSKTGTDPVERSGKYGTTFELPSIQAVGKTAHDFQGWKKGTEQTVIEHTAIPVTFTEADITYYASWKQGEGIKYYIKHWQQNIENDQYTLFETTEGIGTKETETEAVAKTYTGFASKPFAQKTIGTADYDTTVDIYYDRNTITFTFDANGGTGGAARTGRYGASFDAATIPAVTKTNYTLAGWNTYGGTPAAVFETDTTYTAYWASVINVGDLSSTTADIAISAATTADQTSCTVSLPAGFESDTWTYKWYVDGIYNGDDVKTFTRTKAQLGIGVHTITVKAVSSGTVYTKQYTAVFE